MSHQKARTGFKQIKRDTNLNGFAEYKPQTLEEAVRYLMADNSPSYQSESTEMTKMPIKIEYDLSDHLKDVSNDFKITEEINVPVDMSVLNNTEISNSDEIEYIDLDDDTTEYIQENPEKRIKFAKKNSITENKVIIDMMQHSMLNGCNSRIKRPFIVYSRSLIELLNRLELSLAVNDQLAIQRYMTYRQDIFELMTPQTVDEDEFQSENNTHGGKYRVVYDQTDDIIRNIRSNLKLKQDEIAIRASFLERENIRLKGEIISLECRLRNMKKQ